MKEMPYWLEGPLIRGHRSSIPDGEIAVIGSGLSGASVAYWLQKSGFKPTIIDFEPEKSASFRNAGHILWGTGEPYKTLCAVHGREDAKRIMNLSMFCGAQIRDTIKELGIPCDYRLTGALSFAVDDVEAKDLEDSVRMMQEDGFGDRWLMRGENLKEYGVDFEAAQVCFRSATAHPTKFRNGLINYLQSKHGLSYYERKVHSIQEDGDSVLVHHEHGQTAKFQAVVLCCNAYSKLVSAYFADRETIEPYRGQIIVSKPLEDSILPSGAHSCDHGYIYSNLLPDNRLLIGGWRNNVKGEETGSYELCTNEEISEGLKEFVKNRYGIDAPEWEYEWTGIMGSSTSGLPYVGPTNSPLVFTCAGFTGYGFGWAHGCAKILADIMAGNTLVDGWELLRP